MITTAAELWPMAGECNTRITAKNCVSDMPRPSRCEHDVDIDSRGPTMLESGFKPHNNPPSLSGQQEDVALPTAPWSSGSPQDGRYEEPTTPQGQYQQWQNQQYARTSAAGTAASGAYSSIASTGGGYGSPPPSLSGYGSSSPPPPPPPARRRASPLVANAPRLTVIPAPTKPAAVHSGTAAPTELQQQQQQRRSSPKGRGAGLSKWGSWGISRGGGEANSSGKEATAGGISSRKLLSEPIAERTGLLSSAARPEPTSFGSVRAGGAGSFLSGTLSREQSASASRFAEGGAGGPRRGRGSLPKSGEGFAAAGKPSPFLAARSSLTSSGKKGVTRRSPLEQSAVNPFSASFSDSSIRGNEDHDQPSWLAGYGGGGGANHGGVRAGAGQPLLRRAGASGGYGSGWGGDGGGGGGGGGGWREASSERPKPSGKGRKVDDQGDRCVRCLGFFLPLPTLCLPTSLRRGCTCALVGSINQLGCVLVGFMQCEGTFLLCRR